MGLIELTHTAAAAAAAGGVVFGADMRGKEKMWEQREKPAESQVLWLLPQKK